jgi:hypothetical protein
MNQDLKLNLNENQYIWHINLITNLGNSKQIIIIEKGESLEIAREHVLLNILTVSRYGIPCYNFENGNYSLKPMARMNDFKEYYEISHNFIEKVYSIIPYTNINSITNSNINLELNVYAKPFIPLFINKQ